MPVKLKYGNSTRGTAQSIAFRHRILRGTLVVALAGLVLFAAVFGYFYYHYQKVVDDRLASGPIFANVSQIYAAPREVRNGQKLSASAIARDLRQAGYNSNAQLGTFQLNGDNIFIKPGPQSFHTTDGATITTPPKPASPSAPTSWSPSSSPRSLKTRTAPSAASSATTRFLSVSCRPLPPSKTAASSITEALTTTA